MFTVALRVKSWKSDSGLEASFCDITQRREIHLSSVQCFTICISVTSLSVQFPHSISHDLSALPCHTPHKGNQN